MAVNLSKFEKSTEAVSFDISDAHSKKRCGRRHTVCSPHLPFRALPLTNNATHVLLVQRRKYLRQAWQQRLQRPHQPNKQRLKSHGSARRTTLVSRKGIQEPLYVSGPSISEPNGSLKVRSSLLPLVHLQTRCNLSRAVEQQVELNDKAVRTFFESPAVQPFNHQSFCIAQCTVLRGCHRLKADHGKFHINKLQHQRQPSSAFGTTRLYPTLVHLYHTLLSRDHLQCPIPRGQRSSQGDVKTPLLVHIRRQAPLTFQVR